MKKGSLLLIIVLAVFSLNAQVFTEYFNGPGGVQGADVEGYNDWYVSFKSAEANGKTPVIEEGALYYDDYAGSDIGNVALLDSVVGQEKADQRISTKVVTIGNDTLRPKYGETMYAAFLVSIYPDSWSSYRDFFTWEASSGSSFTRGRVFAKVSNEGADLQLAVSKNSSGDLGESEVIEGGVEVAHLLVLAYECVVDAEDDPNAGKNDIIKLYINPDPTKPASEQDNVLVNIDSNSDYTEGSSKIKINLRQRGVGAYVGGIRVGTDWAEVMQGGSTPVNDINAEATQMVYAFQNNIITAENGMVHVYDLGGKKMLSQFSNGSIQTSLNNGIYLIRFEDLNGKIHTEKVIISKN